MGGAVGSYLGYKNRLYQFFPFINYHDLIIYLIEAQYVIDKIVLWVPHESFHLILT